MWEDQSTVTGRSVGSCLLRGTLEGQSASISRENMRPVQVNWLQSHERDYSMANRTTWMPISSMENGRRPVQVNQLESCVREHFKPDQLQSCRGRMWEETLHGRNTCRLISSRENHSHGSVSWEKKMRGTLLWPVQVNKLQPHEGEYSVVTGTPECQYSQGESKKITPKLQ